jgi:flagellar M-ring protein FliF
MDFLNKAAAQLTDLFRSMTPGARITAGLLLVAVVISLGYLFRYEAGGADTYLLSGAPIQDRDLQVMQAAFGKAKLDDFVIEGSKIRVPHGQQGLYMGALADAKALPANFGSILNEAVDKGNPFESAAQREERMRIATQEELALVIRNMPGIERASVLIAVENKPGGFGRERVKTASVSVKAVGTEPVKESQVESIRYTVGFANGMKPESVTVADLNSGLVYHGDMENGGAGGENLYLAVKTRWERELKTKILGALSYIPNLTVETNVELNREKFTHTSTVDYTKPVTIDSKTKGTTHSRDGSAGGGGRPGYQATSNGAASLAGAAAKGSHDEEEDTTEEQHSVPGTTQVEKENVGLTPDLVKVAVIIPNSYFEKVWRERNPPPTGQEAKPPDAAALDAVRTEETAKIQKHVAALLPPAKTTTDINDLVTITSLQDIKPADIPTPGTGQKVVVWLAEYWSTLGMIGLGLVSLLVLRSMVRSVPGATEGTTEQLRVASEPATAGEAGQRERESPETVAARRLRRFSGGGPSLRDELSELVQEDPDAAANILRAWIGNGP